MKVVLPIILMVVILACWEVGTYLFAVPTYLLPSPLSILQRAITDWGTVTAHIWVTCFEAFSGFILGAFGAVCLATLFFVCKPIEQAFYPYMIALKSAPIVAIAPVLTVWLGNGYIPKVMMSALICFFPIVVNALRGFQSVSPEASDLFNSLSASWFQRFRLLHFPAALPYIFSALKVSATLAVIGAIVSEMTGADAGLGYLIQVSSRQLDTEMMFVGVLGSSLLGWGGFYFVRIVEMMLAKWSQPETQP